MRSYDLFATRLGNTREYRFLCIAKTGPFVRQRYSSEEEYPAVNEMMCGERFSMKFPATTFSVPCLLLPNNSTIVDSLMVRLSDLFATMMLRSLLTIPNLPKESKVFTERREFKHAQQLARAFFFSYDSKEEVLPMTSFVVTLEETSWSLKDQKICFIHIQKKHYWSTFLKYNQYDENKHRYLETLLDGNYAIQRNKARDPITIRRPTQLHSPSFVSEVEPVISPFSEEVKFDVDFQEERNGAEVLYGFMQKSSDLYLNLKKIYDTIQSENRSGILLKVKISYQIIKDESSMYDFSYVHKSEREKNDRVVRQFNLLEKGLLQPRIEKVHVLFPLISQ